MILQLTQSIQDATANCQDSAMIGGGIALTLPGLMIWLAGLSMGKIATAATGGLIGLVCGYAFIGRSNLMLGACAFGGLVAALILEQLLATIFGHKSYIYNFIGAAFYASVGTAFIFLGMILLLLFKGVEPTIHIARREQFYSILLFAMFVFGTIEQIMLCTKVNKIFIKLKPRNKQDQSQDQQSWRNR